MGRKRARSIATAIVASTVLVTAASADFTVTSNSAQTLTAPQNRVMRVVVSIRNTSGAPKTISVVPSVSTANCMATMTRLIGGGTPTNIGLVAGQQVQLVVTTSGAMIGNMNASCGWSITGGASGPEMFTTNFFVSATSTETWDPQAHMIDFGTPAPAEVQRYVVGHYGMGMSTYMSIGIQQMVGPGGSVRFSGGPCNGSISCSGQTLGSGSAFPYDIECRPTNAGFIAGQIVLYGASAPIASTDFQCNGTMSVPGPEIDVSPLALSANTTAVGQTSTTTMPLVITNTGNAPLNVGLAFQSNEWSAVNNTCVPSCVVGPTSSTTIPLEFTPSQHGNRDSSVTVTSNDVDEPSIDVSLAGTGNGGVLDVTDPDPPDFLVDFGTIAKGSPVTRTVAMRNTGNVPITVGIGTPGAPFTTSPASVALGANNGTGSFGVTCESPTALAEVTRSIALTPSANTYESNTMMVQARCTVANTTLQVMPSVLDFGEVRKGSKAGEILIKITNPMSALQPVTLKYVRLSGSKPGLSLSPMIGEQMMIPGASVMTTLELTTAMDVDVAGVDLEVGVDMEQLVLPIRGKVVTPSAYVAPAEIDLGTACVGTSVRQNVLLNNNGTATLRVLRPTMDASNAFRPLFLDPSAYPDDGAELRAGEIAMVAVEPALSSTGVLTGELTWDVVDLDAAPFSVPLRVQYIDTGTALSPASLAFGTIAITTASSRQTVTLQNCSTDPVLVDILGVRARQGAAAAWNIQPSHIEGRVLAPQEKMPVTVAFEPERPGHHVAEIELAVQGEPMTVELVGDGFGSVPDPTSFYACTCSGGRAPLGGLPIGLAVLFVLRRRRR